MGSEDLGMVIVLVTLILTTGSVLMFRPLVSRMSQLLELIIADRRRMQEGTKAPSNTSERLTNIENRLALLEEWQDLLPTVHQTSLQSPAPRTQPAKQPRNSPPNMDVG